MYISNEVGVILALAAFSGKAHLGGISFQKIQCKVPGDSEVFSTVIHMGSGFIFIENNIQAPMEGIFYSPVGTHSLGE